MNRVGVSLMALAMLAAEDQAADRDSIWVVWGGNSIRDPVIY